MKVAAFALLLAPHIFAQTPAPACEPKPPKFAISRDPAQHPTPSPQNGKAIVYFLGTGAFALDGQWIAAVDRTYSFLELDPGEHHVCVSYPSSLPPFKFHLASAHSLDAKAGGTYYFLAYDNPRAWSDFTLTQLDPDEGARILTSTKFSTSRPK